MSINAKKGKEKKKKEKEIGKRREKKAFSKAQIMLQEISDASVIPTTTQTSLQQSFQPCLTTSTIAASAQAPRADAPFQFSPRPQ